MNDVSMTAARAEALSGIVRGLVPGWQVAEIDGFEYLSGGYSNENYRFRHTGADYVLRVPDRVRPFVDRTHEASFYRRDHGVRIAELVAFDPVTGNMITRYEPGTLLCDAEVGTSDIIGYLDDLQAALPPAGRCYDPVLLAREYLAEGDPPGWIRQLAADLHWSPAVSMPCHNDLNPWNVILPEAGPWVTLDWEWYGDNDPLFDLVTLHQGLGLDRAVLTGMLAGWRHGPVDDGRLNGCLTAFWLREYAWAHAERHHGNDRPEIGDQLAHASARLRALQSGTSSG